MELPTSHAWQPDQPLSRHQMDLHSDHSIHEA